MLPRDIFSLDIFIMNQLNFNDITSYTCFKNCSNEIEEYNWFFILFFFSI